MSSGKSTSYDGDAHRALSEKRKEAPMQEVFKQRDMNPRLNPFGIQPRECRDSPLYPNATAIMFFMDETSSMRQAPVYMSKTGLPTFLGYVYNGGLVSDPQPLLGAFGDAENPNAKEVSPLQVGQFEGEESKIDADLLAIHLEGGGGNNPHESAELPFYVAARLTSIDCYEKRGQRGHCIVLTDEPAAPRVSMAVVKRLIGHDLPANIPLADIVAEAGEKFHLYVLIPYQDRAPRCERPWRDVLGDRVIVMETHEDSAAVSAALIGLTEGTIPSIDDLTGALSRLGVDEDQARRVYRAVEGYASSIGRGGQSRPTKRKE